MSDNTIITIKLTDTGKIIKHHLTTSLFENNLFLAFNKNGKLKINLDNDITDMEGYLITWDLLTVRLFEFILKNKKYIACIKNADKWIAKAGIKNEIVKNTILN